MTSLVNLSATPSFQYDWATIEDQHARSAAKTAVDSYSVQFHALKDQASKLLETNTLALSKCVLVLKESLQHGEFLDVCQSALKLNKDKASSLVSVGKALMQGTVPSEALELLNEMEPRAASKFLKQDEETKHRYVATFEAEGRVPSQRDFAKHRYVATFEAAGRVEQHENEDKQILEPTQSKWEAKERFVSSKIRLSDAVGAVALMLTEQNTASEKTAELLKELRSEIDRLLKTCP